MPAVPFELRGAIKEVCDREDAERTAEHHSSVDSQCRRLKRPEGLLVAATALVSEVKPSDNIATPDGYSLYPVSDTNLDDGAGGRLSYLAVRSWGGSWGSRFGSFKHSVMSLDLLIHDGQTDFDRLKLATLYANLPATVGSEGKLSLVTARSEFGRDPNHHSPAINLAQRGLYDALADNHVALEPWVDEWLSTFYGQTANIEANAQAAQLSAAQ